MATQHTSQHDRDVSELVDAEGLWGTVASSGGAEVGDEAIQLGIAAELVRGE